MQTTTEPLPAFESLGLAPALLDAIRDAGYREPTPIQAQAIPLALKGRDLMGLAQTGTGKTAAFTLPIVQRLLGGPDPAPMKCRHDVGRESGNRL